jgi:hypothetical protein
MVAWQFVPVTRLATLGWLRVAGFSQNQILPPEFAFCGLIDGPG